MLSEKLFSKQDIHEMDIVLYGHTKEPVFHFHLDKVTSNTIYIYLKFYVQLFLTKPHHDKSYVGCLMASRISRSVEEEDKERAPAADCPL